MVLPNRSPFDKKKDASKDASLPHDGGRKEGSRENRENFLGRVGELCKVGARGVYAQALMDDRFHLLLSSGNKSISQNILRKFGYSGAAVARFFGITNSLVNRHGGAEELADLG